MTEWGSGRNGYRENERKTRRQQERWSETGRQAVKECDFVHIHVAFQWQAHSLIRIRWTVAATASAEFQ